MAANNMFQQGNFSGYNVKGRCKIVNEYTHQIEQHGYRYKKPAYGRFMAILDDPALIDENDGKRLPDSKIGEDYENKKPVDFFESRFSGIETPAYTIPTKGRLTTASKDGAFLEKNIVLPNGKAVLIRWDFLIGQNNVGNYLALNDFALIDVIDKNGKILLNREVLSQTCDIKDGQWSTGWRSFIWPRREFIWPSVSGFDLTIRVVVCNGYSYSDDNPATIDQLKGARSFPSGLLIDCITIV